MQPGPVLAANRYARRSRAPAQQSIGCFAMPGKPDARFLAVVAAHRAEFIQPTRDQEFVTTDGSSATFTHTCTWGVPRKYQTKAGPSSRQQSHTWSLPISPSL